MPKSNDQARWLFERIAPQYDLPAEVFSFWQYGRWRRWAIARMNPKPGSLVLDVATGTGLVARDLRARGVRVVGIDLVPSMLRGAVARSLTVLAGQAEHLPFEPETFDGLTFTYMLRYVDDPAGTLSELVRVLKPGARMASVEFGVPSGVLTKPLWDLYTSHVFPVAGALYSNEWKVAAEFLGPSIKDFNRWMPPERLESFWRGAGMNDVHTRSLSFGAGVVTWGRKR